MQSVRRGQRLGPLQQEQVAVDGQRSLSTARAEQLEIQIVVGVALAELRAVTQRRVELGRAVGYLAVTKHRNAATAHVHLGLRGADDDDLRIRYRAVEFLTRSQLHAHRMI